MFDYVQAIGNRAYCTWKIDLLTSIPDHPVEYDTLPRPRWRGYESAEPENVNCEINLAGTFATMTFTANFDFNGPGMSANVVAMAMTPIFADLAQFVFEGPIVIPFPGPTSVTPGTGTVSVSVSAFKLSA